MTIADALDASARRSSRQSLEQFAQCDGSPVTCLYRFRANGSWTRFRDGLLAALQAYTLPAVLEATKIEIIVADENWRASGAAAPALERTYLGDFWAHPSRLPDLLDPIGDRSVVPGYRSPALWQIQETA